MPPTSGLKPPLSFSLMPMLAEARMRHGLLTALSTVCVLTVTAVLSPLHVAAVPMENDPKGFEGVPWGVKFQESEEFLLVEKGLRVKGYELKNSPTAFGPAAIDSLRFVTIDGLFGRVTIRYHGPENHKTLVQYLESKYGPLDRTPGQIAKQAVKQGNWRGEDTEINLSYDSRTDRGIMFIESRSLATRFVDGMAGEPDNLGSTF